MINPCICPFAGFCFRHIGTPLENKTKPLYELCKNNEKYRSLWDEMAAKVEVQYPKQLKHDLSEFTEEEIQELDRIKLIKNSSITLDEDKTMTELKKERAKEKSKKIEKAKAQKVKKARGLGDTVANVLGALGITEERYGAIKEKLTGKKGCGCEDRQKALNQLFPYKQEELIEDSPADESPEQIETNP